MPITQLVTERRTGKTFSRGNNARRIFDVSGVADELEAIALLATNAGVDEGTAHPLDPSLTVPQGGITWSREGRMFVATVDYAGQPGFSFEGNYENLLAQKWRFATDISLTEEKADRDYDGNPLIFSSGEPIADQTRPVPEIVIPMWRWQASFALSTYLDYFNKWNSDAVVLPKLGTAQPGQLLCQMIRLKDEVSADAQIVPVLYIIRARPLIQLGPDAHHGFHRRILDVATVAKNSTGIDFITYKTGKHKGQQVTTPVLMDGLGSPIDTANYDVSGSAAVAVDAPTVLDLDTEDAAFLLYDLTDGPIEFAGLDIGANL